MNRLKKEELKQYNEATKNLGQEDKKIYDLILQFNEKFESMAKQLQSTIFPEETDFILDSNVDAQERKRGNNPMTQEYIEKANEKRVRMGFQPLNESGYAVDSDDTLEYCKKLILKRN